VILEARLAAIQGYRGAASSDRGTIDRYPYSPPTTRRRCWRNTLSALIKEISDNWFKKVTHAHHSVA